ncbi:hypothetical protein UPYG_G00321020 [Umbra pygmaea]|uniref:Uncharacterized protein n=1 Tax=Umbra pygmaea TaxID=75934 RepID=A0ABD0WHR8_UMBPY
MTLQPSLRCLADQRQNCIDGNKERNPENKEANKKKLNEHDYHLLAKVLSLGLVDADPNYLQHLKDYRDLRGGSS